MSAIAALDQEYAQRVVTGLDHVDKLCHVLLGPFAHLGQTGIINQTGWGWTMT
jgi:hypothetical protein